MTSRYTGGLITGTPPTFSGSYVNDTANANVSGVFTVSEASRLLNSRQWLLDNTLPGAPTIGTATTAGSNVSVTFTAPTDTGGLTITQYRVTSNPGSITTTGSSSPVIATGLTAGTSYTFTVAAQNSLGYGPESAASNSAAPEATGQVAYTTPGSYTWTAPAGVTSISAFLVGSGWAAGSADGGGGGGTRWINNYSVTPGSSYNITVGSSTRGGPTVDTTAFGITAGSANSRSGAGGSGGNGGYSGGNGGSSVGGWAPGGGAGGYGGNGSNAQDAGGYNAGCNSGNGGGVGLLGGTGPGGAAGQLGQNGGSPGAAASGGSGTSYGGGGKGCYYDPWGGPLPGAIRIIYPGNSRSYPNTNTGNL